MTDEQFNPVEVKLGTGRDVFSPVTVTDTFGAVALGILSIILLSALLRALRRNRELEVQLVARSI